MITPTFIACIRLPPHELSDHLAYRRDACLQFSFRDAREAEPERIGAGTVGMKISPGVKTTPCRTHALSTSRAANDSCNSMNKCSPP